MGSFAKTDAITQAFERVIKQACVPKDSEELFVGLDIGTAYMVLAVLDAKLQPIAGAYRFAQVVRDGIVVDYLGAIDIVKDLKQEIESAIGRELDHTAIAIPPGTSYSDTRFIGNVAESAGLHVVNVVNEPEAANTLLQLHNGVVVDIGGGTTGLAIIENGEVVYTADEPTGGTHCTLVVAGRHKISFEEAEELKKDPARQDEMGRLLKPVSQKIASIIKRHITGHTVSEIVLVGGASCLVGIEDVVSEELGIPTVKPAKPLFITPIGIAMNCRTADERTTHEGRA
ncbi:MAG: ethanolamine utilization protein EutJ [Coriobacteriales bacterium]|jgi:ethanolamine utilization protein EutJ|nr:ethanolamine utilization protein EutJ [Coriobacteriales bacterium]